MANKAGLSIFEFYDNFYENMLDKQVRDKFSKHFLYHLKKYKGKKIELCESALVSEKMFRHIKVGKFLKKEPILALLIVMNLDLDEIQKALRMAGLILSRSMYNDVVVIWIIENNLHNRGAKRLQYINEVLESLGLPLLMTRMHI